MPADYFAHKAGAYDRNCSRVDNVANIADAILNTISLDRSQHILDFGSGTGLLLERIAPHVGRITAVDVSPAMNRQLQAKQALLGCPLEIVEVDLTRRLIDGPFDGVMSSMTLHHIQDIAAMLGIFHSLLKPGGFLALADLDREDGSFHSEDTGVYHHGFDRDLLAQIATLAGFQSVRLASASVVRKPQGDFPVFLLTARR